MTHRSVTSFDVTSLQSQSPPDLRVRSEMWKGQIPVLFNLAPHEVTSMEDPPPLAMLVPRMSYFPLVLGDVRTHFRDMTPAMEDELWLEYDGIPLKWNIPIGVLFDLLCPSTPTSDTASLSSGQPNMVLPWKLVVHFQSFPSKRLTRCRTLFTVRQHYLNTWKESCYIRFASTRIAMSCLASDHQKMWDALVHLREDIHVATNARIVSAGMMGGAAQQTAGGSTPQHTGLHLVQAALEYKSVEDLPIRIYLHCTRPSHEEGMNQDGHMCPLQRSIKPKGKDGQETTVKDLITQHLSALIDKTNTTTNTSTSPSGSTAASAGEIHLLPNVRLMVQGFCPPLSTPLSWLCTYCSHPDGFLYFTVHLVEQETEEEMMMRDPFQHGAGGGMESGFGSGLHHGSMSGSMSGSMFGGGGGGFFGGGGAGGGSGYGMMPSFNPSTLPGYHAASNAVNVVYQNLPSLPMALPSVASFFGGAAPATQTQQPPLSSVTSPQPQFSSASAMDSPPPSQEDTLPGDMEAAPEDPSIMRGGEEHHDVQASTEDLP